MDRFTIYDAGHLVKVGKHRGRYWKASDFQVLEEDGTEDGRLVASFGANEDEARAYAAWRNESPAGER